MNIATFDIETSGLEAVGAGFLLCVVVKPLNSEKPITLRYDTLGCKPAHETKLLEQTLEVLKPFDLLVGHNVINFDLAWLRSRAILLDLPFDLDPFVYDTCQAFRRSGFRTVMGFNGKPKASLAHVIDFFGIPLQKEYPIFPREHWKSVWEVGDSRTEAMNHLVSHCTSDVLANEQVYHRLLKVDRNSVIKRIR